MSIILAPDIEQLVVQFLLDQDEVTDLIGTDVYSVIPKDHFQDRDARAVRVYQYLDEQVMGPALWLVRTALQIDVWGGPKKTTRLIAETVRAVLIDRLAGTHDEGIVTGVAVRGLNTTPDGDFTPARPRCRFDVDVWAHPSTTVGS